MIEVTKKENGTLALTGEATVFTAEDLHKALLEHLPGEDENVTVDLSKVSAVDVAGAQIFISWRRTCGHQKVSFVGCPEEVTEHLEKVGLAKHIF